MTRQIGIVLLSIKISDHRHRRKGGGGRLIEFTYATPTNLNFVHGGTKTQTCTQGQESKGPKHGANHVSVWYVQHQV